MLKAVLTEKSLRDAKTNKYTFLVDRRLNKDQIKALVAKTFSVRVTGIATMNSKALNKVTARGLRRTVKPVKKAIVLTKEKIELFEEKK